MKIWIFLGHCSFQIQFQPALVKGTLAWCYKNFDAKQTEQTLLLWGHTKESDNLVSWATRMPCITCSSCVRRGNCNSYHLQVLLSHRELTNLCSSLSRRGPWIQFLSGLSGNQWFSHTGMVWLSPKICFIPCLSHFIPTWKAFQMWDALGFMPLSNKFVRGKYLAFKTWAHSMDDFC